MGVAWRTDCTQPDLRRSRELLFNTAGQLIADTEEKGNGKKTTSQLPMDSCLIMAHMKHTNVDRVIAPP